MVARCALALLAFAVVAGCGGRGWEARRITRVEADGSRLSVGAHCHPDARASAVESDDTVEVRFEVKGDHMGDCYGVAEVELERPLGDRQVIDATSDERVPVEAHP